MSSHRYMPLGKPDDEVYAASMRNRWLTRRCLLVVLVICLLAVALALVRWVLLSRSHFHVSWLYRSDENQKNAGVVKGSTFSEGCTGGTSNESRTDKPQTTAVNAGLQNSTSQESGGFSAPCPAGALAELAENVYSDDDFPIRRLPQCLIIGVRKGGTRALLEFLNLHPDVQAERREVHFFDNDNRYGRGLEWYRHQMHATHKGQITLEKTPAYFVEDEVASRVYQMNSSIRLLVTFRDPVERAISDYLQIQEQREAKGKSRLSFERLVIDSDTGEVDDAYQAVRRSMYDLHLNRWLHYFHIDQFHFLSAENLVANPAAELQRVEKFLGLRHKLSKELFYYNQTRGFYCMCVDQRKRESNPDRQITADGKCLSSSKGRTHPSIDPRVLNKLREFFRPHNERLYKMVGVNFGWK